MIILLFILLLNHKNLSNNSKKMSKYIQMYQNSTTQLNEWTKKNEKCNKNILSLREENSKLKEANQRSKESFNLEKKEQIRLSKQLKIEEERLNECSRRKSKMEKIFADMEKQKTNLEKKNENMAEIEKNFSCKMAADEKEFKQLLESLQNYKNEITLIVFFINYYYSNCYYY